MTATEPFQRLSLNVCRRCLPTSGHLLQPPEEQAPEEVSQRGDGHLRRHHRQRGAVPHLRPGKSLASHRDLQKR